MKSNTTFSSTGVLILLMICFNFPIQAFAQTGFISGTVVDSKTRESIPFVNVALYQKNRIISNVSTDHDGKYNFVAIAAGIYYLKATFVGYHPVVTDTFLLKQDSLKVINITLSSDYMELDVYEVIDYKVPLIDKDKTSVGATVSDAEMIYVEGIRVRGTSSLSESLETNALLSDDVIYNPYTVYKPGQLTAAEVNDFSKWDLWKDIKEKDLNSQQKLWGITPNNRYSVQVKTKDNFPVADATVYLKDQSGQVIWISRTDNTGKAELWSSMFVEKQKAKSLIVTAGDQEYLYGNPNSIQNGINVLIVPNNCTTPVNAQIAFVVDATGSMGDEMDYLKAELLDIIESVDDGKNGLTTTLASVFYRDLGDEYVTRFRDFTTNFKEISNFSNEQNAYAGGDYPEAFDEAYHLAVNKLSWSKEARARILFLLLDAPPHSDPENLELLKKTIKDAAQKGIRTVPIIASGTIGADPESLEYLMRSIALATNGTYVFLTDHSNIGNAHDTPVTDSYDVEYLNELIKRIISQYTYMPDCNQAPDAVIKPDTTLITTKKIIKHEVVDSTRTIASINPDPIIVDFTKEQPKDSLLVIHDTLTVVNDSIQGTDIQSPQPEIKEIKFYPNPTTGQLTIRVSGEIEEIYLLDISGKLLQIINSKSGNVTIDISKYSNGFYFLKFIENGKSYTGKIVLRK